MIGRHHARPHTLHRHQRTLLLHLHTRSALSTSKQHCQPPIGGCIKLSLSECGPKCLATRGGLLCTRSRGTARPGWPTPIGFACPPELARPAWFLAGVRHTLGRRSARVARMRNETSNKSIKSRLYQELCRSNGPVGGFEGWCHKMGQSRGSALESWLGLCRAASHIHATPSRYIITGIPSHAPLSFSVEGEGLRELAQRDR